MHHHTRCLVDIKPLNCFSIVDHGHAFRAPTQAPMTRATGYILHCKPCVHTFGDICYIYRQHCYPYVTNA
jgi:hypothetical protein